MTADRHELHHLVDKLPDDQLNDVAEEMRRRLRRDNRGTGSWPPDFFAIGESSDGRTDHARNVDNVLAEGFAARRS